MKTLIQNVTVYPITSDPFSGEVLIDNGKIIEVKPKIDSKADEIIDGKGGLLFPGFIDAHSHIGLMAEGQGWQYEDVNEMTNPVTSDVRSLDAFVPTDRALKEAALGGVMAYCVLTGSGNPVGGLCFVAKHTSSNLTEDKVILTDSGLKMATGENPKMVYSEKKQMPVTRMGTAAVIRKFFYDGQNYMKKKEKALKEGKPFAEKDAKLESAEMVLTKKIPARIHCHRAEDMLTAIRIKKEFDIDIVIEHATEYIKVKDEIKENKVPIILGPVLSCRSKVELKDMTYLSFKTAVDEGILFASMSDHPVFPSQVLHLQAGVAVSYGASETGMLKSLTINPAKILKIDDKYGSIEEGKEAMLCLWNGHPFDSRSRVIWNTVDGYTNLN